MEQIQPPPREDCAAFVEDETTPDSVEDAKHVSVGCLHMNVQLWVMGGKRIRREGSSTIAWN